MRLVENSPSKIVIEANISPLYKLVRGIGVVIAPLAFWMWASPGGSPISTQTVIIVCCMSLPFMVYAIVPFFIADIRTTFDKAAGHFVLERKATLGRTRVIRRPLSDVGRIFVARYSLAYCRMKVEIVTGEHYPLGASLYRLADKPRLSRQAEAINQFIKMNESQYSGLEESKVGFQGDERLQEMEIPRNRILFRLVLLFAAAFITIAFLVFARMLFLLR